MKQHLTQVLNYLLLQEGPRTMVGIATFDSTVHFYNLKRALQQVNRNFPSYYCLKVYSIWFIGLVI